MIVAQITDLHIGINLSDAPPTFSAKRKAQDAVRQINRLDPKPDVVFVTGDLTADGQQSEYVQLDEVLSELMMPVYLLPGNHDDRQVMRAHYDHLPYLQHSAKNPSENLHYVIDEFGVRFIALDTVVVGHHGGALSESDCAWLDATLSLSEQLPTYIFMHHPPFQTGMPIFDGMRCDAGPAFDQILSRHKQIKLLACGHIHQSVKTKWNDVLCSAIKSTAFQYPCVLNNNDERLNPVFEPGVIGLYLTNAEGQLITHEVTIPA